MTPEWAQVLVAAGVGVLRCGLIYWGLSQMRIASRQRDRQLDSFSQSLTAQN